MTEDDRSAVWWTVTGAVVLGVVGGLAGPVGGWDGDAWPGRLAYTAACALGGGLAGLRAWMAFDRD